MITDFLTMYILILLIIIMLATICVLLLKNFLIEETLTEKETQINFLKDWLEKTEQAEYKKVFDAVLKSIERDIDNENKM